MNSHDLSEMFPVRCVVHGCARWRPNMHCWRLAYCLLLPNCFCQDVMDTPNLRNSRGFTAQAQDDAASRVRLSGLYPLRQGVDLRLWWLWHNENNGEPL
jgi:hypothetical protein